MKRPTIAELTAQLEASAAQLEASRTECEQLRKLCAEWADDSRRLKLAIMRLKNQSSARDAEAA